MDMIYDNRADAVSRLMDTVIFYKGAAFYVEDISRDLEIIGHSILSKEPLVINQEDSELSVACPEIGFVNTPRGAHYFMRQPMRRWKQGLDFRSLICPYSGIRPRGLLTLDTLASCLENNYPSFKESIHIGRSLNPFKTHEGLPSRAFCKTFSVASGTEGLLLNYKGREVGVVEGEEPILSSKFQWLRESLEGALSR
jgi:hypothetical protein